MERKSAIRFLIADHQEVYRHGIKMLIDDKSGIEVIGEAAKDTELYSLAKVIEPDVIAIAIDMPMIEDIISCVKSILCLKHTTVVIILLNNNNNESDDLLIKLIQAGIFNFLVKSSGKKEIIEAIYNASIYKSYYSPEVAFKLTQLLVRLTSKEKNIIEERLGEKEIDIIQLICKDFSNKEISKALFIGVRTVEGLRLKILKKIHAKGTAGVVVFAINNGYFKA